jgi:16S rRNA (adenine1518-N6/adenine1519-N6)-dimethyltransferase
VTLTRTEVHALFDRYGISPKRSLGQNFVVEPNTVRRIAHLAAVGEGDRVVEIGPGLGSLTIALADAAGLDAFVELAQLGVEFELDSRILAPYFDRAARRPTIRPYPVGPGGQTVETPSPRPAALGAGKNK